MSTPNIVTLWKEGESLISKDFVIKAESGLDSVEAGYIKVSGGDKAISIMTSADAEVMVYTVDGCLLKTMQISGSATISVNTGVYVVKVADRMFKVAVK